MVLHDLILAGYERVDNPGIYNCSRLFQKIVKDNKGTVLFAILAKDYDWSQLKSPDKYNGHSFTFSVRLHRYDYPELFYDFEVRGVTSVSHRYEVIEQIEGQIMDMYTTMGFSPNPNI